MFLEAIPRPSQVCPGAAGKAATAGRPPRRWPVSHALTRRDPSHTARHDVDHAWLSLRAFVGDFCERNRS